MLGIFINISKAIFYYVVSLIMIFILLPIMYFVILTKINKHLVFIQIIIILIIGLILKNKIF